MMSDSFSDQARKSFAYDMPFIQELLDLAQQASMKILSVRSSYSSRIKADGSMVTEADEAAEEIILSGLDSLAPGIRTVSEEAECRSHTTLPLSEQPFILVDPLDGTKEFIEGRDEFTVNIGLIVDGKPVAGVITAPALGIAWYGIEGHGAWSCKLATSPGRRQSTSISTRWPSPGGLTAIVSLSHLDDATLAFVESLPVRDRVSYGSSLKFCRLAEGAADVYPRLSTTCEWDLAAGHAVLQAAGGAIYDLEGQPLRYGASDRDFRVSGFTAWGKPELRHRIASGHDLTTR